LSIIGSFFACTWATGGRTGNFIETSACVADISNDEYSSVCAKIDNSITFTYTFRYPLLDDVNYAVSCVQLTGDSFEDEVSFVVQGIEWIAHVDCSV